MSDSVYSEALIRQFFEKRGYIKALEAFNKATEASPKVSAVDLINKKTRKIAKANKEREKPFKSLLEALVRPLIPFTKIQ